MHPVKEYQYITLTVDGLNWVRFVTLTRRRWMSNNYITRVKTGISHLVIRCGRENQHPAEGPSGPRLSSCSWRSEFWSSVPDRAVRTSFQRRAEPQASGWAAQENEKDTLLCLEELVRSICCSLCSVSNSLSHTQPFPIKWEVYFSKEQCPFVIIIVLNMCMVAYVLCGYTTISQWSLTNILTNVSGHPSLPKII